MRALLALALALPLAGCTSVPGEHGRTYLLGQATIVESGATDGACGYYQLEWSTDDGKDDDGKAEAKTRMHSATAPCRIVEGGSISDNLSAAIGFLAGVLF